MRQESGGEGRGPDRLGGGRRTPGLARGVELGVGVRVRVRGRGVLSAHAVSVETGGVGEALGGGEGAVIVLEAVVFVAAEEPHSSVGERGFLVAGRRDGGGRGARGGGRGAEHVPQGVGREPRQVARGEALARVPRGREGGRGQRGEAGRGRGLRLRGGAGEAGTLVRGPRLPPRAAAEAGAVRWARGRAGSPGPRWEGAARAVRGASGPGAEWAAAAGQNPRCSQTLQRGQTQAQRVRDLYTTITVTIRDEKNNAPIHQ